MWLPEMNNISNAWTLLVYKIPTHPTRLRLKIWRKLQSMGAVYLQDAVCLLPSRSDLDENMEYVADSIQEMGGTSHLFTAKSVFAEGADRLIESFRQLADSRYADITERIEKVQSSIASAASLTALESAEEELKRERIAYLKTRRVSYFGSDREAQVEQHLDTLRRSLDGIHRGSTK